LVPGRAWDFKRRLEEQLRRETGIQKYVNPGVLLNFIILSTR